MTESLDKLTKLTKDMCKVLDIDVNVANTIDEKLEKATLLIKDAQGSLQVATAVSIAKDEAATALSVAKDEAATALSTAKDEAATKVSQAKDAAVSECKDAQIAQLTADLKNAVEKNNQ